MVVLFLIVLGIIMLILFSFVLMYVNFLNIESYGIFKGVNGGVFCVVCIVVVVFMEQLSVIYNVIFVEVYVKLCYVLFNVYRNVCIFFGKYYILKVIKFIEVDFIVDVICYVIYLCYKEKGQLFCYVFLFKKDVGESVLQVKRLKEEVFLKLFYESVRLYFLKDFVFDFCILEGVKEFCKLFKKVFINDFFLIDFDNDMYSVLVELWRGMFWRGCDCDDINYLSYLGVKLRDGDIVFDLNCNGIYGKDFIFGKFYEELFCKGWCI